jgi:transposase
VYLRSTKVRKNGKTHTYWMLVRSVRRDGRVRQEVVAMLGALGARERARAKALAQWMTGRRMHPSLFEPDPLREARAEAIGSVRMKAVRVERSRRFGDVYLGLALWRSLELDWLFERLMPQGREDLPWSVLVAALVISRLCFPSSELQLAEELYRRTALDNLLDLPQEKVNDDRLYRALDRLLPHKEAVEQHLKARLGELFSVRYDLLLYDVTSTYFEGLAERNPLAQRGYSRDHRPDCKQVCIALVVTREGIPLAYEVFEGNRVDVTTVEEIVEAIEERFGKADRVWVMDRGMASEENLEWLREGERRYLIGTSKSELRHFEAQLLEKKDWKEIREGVEVKLCEGPGGKETFILCRSRTRQEKDHAIVERFDKRLRARLESLRRRLEKAKRRVDRVRAERQIGRMLERHSRAAGKYEVRIEETKELPSGLRLVVEENARWSQWSELTEGCYLLRSNVSSWSEEELWQTYIQLTEAEAAFRIQKSELSIRPIWHQREERVRAHIFVCFLAYALWKTLEQWQQRQGLGRSPRTVLDELAEIRSADVVLPMTDGHELRLRCVVRPEPRQLALLDRLGLELPRRLRLPEVVEKELAL